MLRSRPVHLRGAGANNVPVPTIAISPLHSRLRSINGSVLSDGLRLTSLGASRYGISQHRNISSCRYLGSKFPQSAVDVPSNGLIPAVVSLASVSSGLQLQSARYHEQPYSPRRDSAGKSAGNSSRSKPFTKSPSRQFLKPRSDARSRTPFKRSFANDENEGRSERSTRDRDDSRSKPFSKFPSDSRSRTPFRQSFTKDRFEKRSEYSPRDQDGSRSKPFSKIPPRQHPKPHSDSRSRTPFKRSFTKDKFEERSEYSPRDRDGSRSKPFSKSPSRQYLKSDSRSRTPFKQSFTKDEFEEQPEHSARDEDDTGKSYDPKTLSAMAMRKDVYERAMRDVPKRRLAFAKHVELVSYKGGFQKALSLVISAEKFSVNAMKDSKVHCDSAWNFLLDRMIRKGEIDGATRVFNFMKKLGAVPTAYTYTILFRGLAQSQSKLAPKKALHLYESMHAENSAVKPNIIHTNAALGVCTRHNDMDTLWEISGRLPEYGEDKADATTYTIILHAIQASAKTRIERFQMDEHDVKKAFKIRRKVVSEGKKLWSDVIYKARRAKLVIDQKLVTSMGRVLLFGQRQSDYKDIFALLHQCMKIPLPDETFGSNSVELKKWHYFRNPKPVAESEFPDMEETDERRGRSIEQSEEAEEDPFKTALFDDEGIRTIKSIRRMKPEFKNVPFEIPTPSGEDLSLILEACTSMKNGIAIGRHYWSELTSPEKHKIEPDPPAFHDYLRLLRISRASAESLAIIKDQMVPKGMAVSKTFIITLSTCSRDRNNPNVLDTTTSLIDSMLEARKEPLVKPLMKYIEFIWALVNHQRLAADIRMQQKLQAEQENKKQQAAVEKSDTKENKENTESQETTDDTTPSTSPSPSPPPSPTTPSPLPPSTAVSINELHESRLSQTLKHLHPHLTRIITLLAFGHWKKKLEPKRAAQEPDLDPDTVVDNIALRKLGKNISPTDPPIPWPELVEVLDEALVLHKRLLGPQLAPFLSETELEKFQKVADRLDKFAPFAESVEEKGESKAVEDEGKTEADKATAEAEAEVEVEAEEEKELESGDAVVKE